MLFVFLANSVTREKSHFPDTHFKHLKTFLTPNGCTFVQSFWPLILKNFCSPVMSFVIICSNADTVTFLQIEMRNDLYYYYLLLLLLIKCSVLAKLFVVVVFVFLFLFFFFFDGGSRWSIHIQPCSPHTVCPITHSSHNIYLWILFCRQGLVFSLAENYSFGRNILWFNG